MTRRSQHFRRILAVILTSHLALVIVQRIINHHPEELGWLSHVTLALTAVGLWKRSSLLLSASLINILVLHSLWMFDCTIGMWTGVFPLELANPMLNATIWEWAGTLHHVYLVPLLLMIFLCRRQRWGWNALYLSVFLFAGLTLFSYACLPAISNVNYAFRNEFNPSGLLASWMNVLSDSWYLVALNSIVSGAIFFPTAVLLNRLAMKTRAARRSKSFLQMS